MTATGGVPPRSIDLALQGGGSHGAFTWGVLDALLEDGSLSFSGISGRSKNITYQCICKNYHRTLQGSPDGL